MRGALQKARHKCSLKFLQLGKLDPSLQVLVSLSFEKCP